MSEWCCNVFWVDQGGTWPVGLIGLLSPLLCAGLWSRGTYQPTEKGFSGPFKRPSERVQQAVLCPACRVRRYWFIFMVVSNTTSVTSFESQHFLRRNSLAEHTGPWGLIIGSFIGALVSMKPHVRIHANYYQQVSLLFIFTSNCAARQ